MKFQVLQIREDRCTEKAAMDAMIMGEVDPVFFLSAYDIVCEIEAADLLRNSLDRVIYLDGGDPIQEADAEEAKAVTKLDHLRRVCPKIKITIKATANHFLDFCS